MTSDRYDPYGSFTKYDSSWSPYNIFQTFFPYQGGRYESRRGLYYFRNRDYHPTLGRWIQRDPLEYVEGMNLYNYLRSSPITNLDAMGLGSDTEHPTGASCDPSQDCPTLQANIAKFSAAITSHALFDLMHPNPQYPFGRHEKEIDDFQNGLNNCMKIAQDKGCNDPPPPCRVPSNQPWLFPVPSLSPLTITLIIGGTTVVVVCTACPVCCLIGGAAAAL